MPIVHAGGTVHDDLEQSTSLREHGSNRLQPAKTVKDDVLNLISQVFFTSDDLLKPIFEFYRSKKLFKISKGMKFMYSSRQ